MRITLNLNDEVRFKFTDKGHTIWRNYWTQHDATARVPDPRPDKDGWCRLQLWVLMGIFGPSMQAPTFDAPIESEILL